MFEVSRRGATRVMLAGLTHPKTAVRPELPPVSRDGPPPGHIQSPGHVLRRAPDGAPAGQGRYVAVMSQFTNYR